MKVLEEILLSMDDAVENHYKKYLDRYKGQYYQGDTLVFDSTFGSRFAVYKPFTSCCTSVIWV
mgnify:CR=1 FL=1